MMHCCMGIALAGIKMPLVVASNTSCSTRRNGVAEGAEATCIETKHMAQQGACTNKNPQAP